MTHRFLAGLSLLPAVLAGSTFLQDAGAAGDGFQRYTNPRYKFSVAYPDSLEPGRRAPSGDGRYFESADGTMTLLAWGGRMAGGTEARRSAFNQAMRKLTARGIKPTLSVRKTDWFALSWLSGDRIYYTKTIFRGRNFSSLHLEYPAERKEELDATVTRVSRSLTAPRA